MKEQLTGTQKIQQICTALKEETLQPAKQEAMRIIDEAKKQAAQITERAQADAEKYVAEGRKQIAQERSVFESNLSQASKQALQALRQEVELRLFDNGVQELINANTSNSNVVAQLINAVVTAIEKQGIGVDLEALIPQKVPVEAVSNALGAHMASKLRSGGISLGQFVGGAQVKIVDKRMTIDISDNALRELLVSYTRKDFRKKLFGGTNDQ